MAKPTKQQLVERVASLSIEFYRAQHAVGFLREEYRTQCFNYFRANGEPYPDRHGIDYNDPAFEGVINFTNPSYDRMTKAKRHRYNVKRRMETAVRQLMDLSGDTLADPKRGYVPRVNARGETLQ